MAASFSSSMSMCSARARSTLISPPASPTAARNVAASTRSGMATWDAGRSSSTPSISIRDVPAPSILAPMPVSMAARSLTSGSRAAFSITVVPLASTAAMSRLSVVVWLGNSRTIRVPAKPVAPALDVAVLGPEGHPQLLESPQVHVDRPAAEVVPAGQRDPGPAVAGEERAEHDEGGPDALDELVGRDRGHVGRDVDVEDACCPLAVVDGGHTERRQHLGHDRDVGDGRHVGDAMASGCQQAGGHALEHGVLCTVERPPCRPGGPFGRTTKRSIAADVSGGRPVGAGTGHYGSRR